MHAKGNQVTDTNNNFDETICNWYIIILHLNIFFCIVSKYYFAYRAGN